MPLPQIRELRIKGYKSLADETMLEIRPLTIIAGANSSGKSSAMQPLLLLKQTLASPSNSEALDISGPNVQFTNYEQMFRRRLGKSKSARKISVGLSFSTNALIEGLDLTYSLVDSGMHTDRQVIQTHNDENKPLKITLTPGRMSEAEIAVLPTQIRDFIKDLNKEQKKNFFTFSVRPSRGFLDLGVTQQFGGIFNVGFNSMNLSADRSTREILLNIIHVPGLRGNPSRDYRLIKTKGPRFDGHFQDYVAGIIAQWKDHPLGKHKLARLSHLLQTLGLTWKVDARTVDDTRVELVVGRLKKAKQGGAKDVVNIADVGFGVSQILPALVAMIVAEKNQMVYLEQPEIHLHPRAQKNLANVLAEAAKKKKCLVVETHSSILIRGIQTLVAKGELPPELVKLHWFSQDENTGATKVTSADLDENGAYGAEWPEDFDDTYLESERDYLDAVEARML
jgi:predicted ATPase